MRLNKKNFIEHVAVNNETGCWDWVHSTTNSLPNRSYGAVFQYGKRWTAHRLAYKLFYKNPGKLSVCHKCDRPICCNPKHLFLGTQGDNQRDAYKKGRRRPLFGNRSKLTPEDVKAIKWYISTGMKQREIGEIFKVERGTISKIANERCFAYIPNPTGFWANRRRTGVSH